MLTIRVRTIAMSLCLIEALWLLIAQTLGYSVLLLPCLVCFLALVGWSATKGMAVPVLMFFLPFAALLKTSPGQISFYTLGLLVVYLLCAILYRRKISMAHVAPGVFLAVACLVVKTVYGIPLDNSYLLFAFSLVLVPFVSAEFGKKYDFYWLTAAFTVGIVIAALSSLYLMRFPTIARYIENFELFDVVRHAGYYGDPNFYSAHISTALAGVLILLLNNTSKVKTLFLVFMAMLLVYCGFFAVSKMFFLVSAFLALLFVLEVMFQRGKLSIKLLLLLTFVIGLAFLSFSTAFIQLVDMIVSRFLRDANLSDFTTGRTELWQMYLQSFKEDPVLLLFGNGYINAPLNDRGSHNTIIQAIYQFGLLGCVFLGTWIVCCVRSYLRKATVKWNSLAQICILLVGTIGPWMALDMLLFDEFFLLPIYVCVGIMSLSGNDGSKAFQMAKGKEYNDEKRI